MSSRAVTWAHMPQRTADSFILSPATPWTGDAHCGSSSRLAPSSPFRMDSPTSLCIAASARLVASAHRHAVHLVHPHRSKTAIGKEARLGPCPVTHTLLAWYSLTIRWAQGRCRFTIIRIDRRGPALDGVFY